MSDVANAIGSQLNVLVWIFDPSDARKIAPLSSMEQINLGNSSKVGDQFTRTKNEVVMLSKKVKDLQSNGRTYLKAEPGYSQAKDRFDDQLAELTRRLNESVDSLKVFMQRLSLVAPEAAASPVGQAMKRLANEALCVARENLHIQIA